MANPQKENGYTPIANELYEAMMCFRIPGECEQILKAIIRKTYGYNKKSDNISNSQIVAMVGLKKQNVSRGLSKLIEHKIVIKSDDKSIKGHKLQINKNYQDWIPFVIKSDDNKKKKKVSSKRIHQSSKVMTTVIKSDDKVSSEVMDTKDKRQLKDNIQKKGETPAQNAKQFFKGVEDLIGKRESVEAINVRRFLRGLNEKYPQADKAVVWREIQKFWSYWTELSKSGRKQRWEQQDAFMVDRRLVTWFGKVKDFDRSKIINKETRVGKL